MSEHIPIFCATDENYAPFTSIMMKSVLMHTDSFVDFYVMDGGIKEKSKKLIAKDLKEYPNKKLHFVDMSKYNLDQFPDFVYWSTSMYSRYFIPKIVPNLKKVIYLDVDIIVKKDIMELYNQDMENHPIAAMEESEHFTPAMVKRLKKIWPTYNGKYFNSGVLLLDIKKLVQMDFVNKAMSLTCMLKDKIEFPDQDVLNILFENNTKSLHYSFNCFASMQHINKKNPDFSPDEPVIIHYTTLKPWKHNTLFQQDFDNVLKKSVFYKQVVEKYRSKKISKFYLFGFIPLFKRLQLKKF